MGKLSQKEHAKRDEGLRAKTQSKQTKKGIRMGRDGQREEV